MASLTACWSWNSFLPNLDRSALSWLCALDLIGGNWKRNKMQNYEHFAQRWMGQRTFYIYKQPPQTRLLPSLEYLSNNRVVYTYMSPENVYIVLDGWINTLPTSGTDVSVDQTGFLLVQAYLIFWSVDCIKSVGISFWKFWFLFKFWNFLSNVHPRLPHLLICGLHKISCQHLARLQIPSESHSM